MVFRHRTELASCWIHRSCFLPSSSTVLIGFTFSVNNMGLFKNSMDMSH